MSQNRDHRVGRRAGTIESSTVTAADFGLQAGTIEDFHGGGDVDEERPHNRAVLAGEQGPRRTITLLNAGAGLYRPRGAELPRRHPAGRPSDRYRRGARKLEEQIAFTNDIVAGAVRESA